MSFIQPPFWAIPSSVRQSLHAVAIVVTPPAVEPISVTEVKGRFRLPTGTTEDADLALLIRASRVQVEKDLNGACLVPTVLDQWQDRFHRSRVLEILRWPLQSVASVKTYDQDDVEATFASSKYLVDTSLPGRVLLNADESWPTSLRIHRAIAVRHTCGFGGAAKTVSSIVRASTTATVTTAAAHGYATGQRITIAGADQADYNGTFEIVVTGATTFTFTVAGSPTTPATGVLTATSLGIPETYLMAMMMLIGHWYMNREAGAPGAVATLPLAYESLISDAPVCVV